jgi:Protein of unknown function (DUF2380)
MGVLLGSWAGLLLYTPNIRLWISEDQRVRQSLSLGLALVICAGSALAATPDGGTHRPRLVVLDVELTGDLGGPEFVAQHDARLKMASARLRENVSRTGLYSVVDPAPAQDLIDQLESQYRYLHDCNGCDLDIGRQLEADQVLVAWVNRVSGLILSLTYEIRDVATGQITARKTFGFRGDNDVAWTRAIDYLVRDQQESDR